MKIVEPFVPQSQSDALGMEYIDQTKAFFALRDDWAVLHAACPARTPFNSWEWLFSWWQAYGYGKQLRLLVCRSRGELVAVAPLYVATEKTAVGTAVRVLRMLGDGSADSDYLGFLLHPGFGGSAMAQICDLVARDDCWDAATLRELPESSLLPEGFGRTAEKHGLLSRLEHGRCGAVDLPKTFDEFLKARQPRFRTKLRSLLKRLEESGLAFETAVAPNQIRARLRSLYALHQARWQAAGVTGVFTEKAKRLFYAHFVPRFARRGWLRLYSLRDGDTYLAHQLCFGAEGITYLLQEGFDVSSASESYGQMLRAAVMRHLIENGEVRYDFLGGFSRHKQDWGAAEAKTVHLTLARPCWRGKLYFKLPLWREVSAQAAKQLLPSPAIRTLKRIRAALS